MSDFNDILNKLTDGTTAEVVKNSVSMHNQKKVTTPLIALNCLLGGGLPLGCMVEAFGVPQSGKSSMMYQTLGNFQREYPEGIGVIVDTEASVDPARMNYLGCDNTRLLRIPATTLEHGFSQLFQILESKGKDPKLKDLPIFVLWDTIGISPSDRQFETGDMYASGMMGNAKLIKNSLSILLPYIEQQPLLVVLLNQVTTQVNSFGGASLGSGGGWGIKHNAHLRLLFRDGKTEYIDGIWAATKSASIDIVKSKLSPLFEGIPSVIDIKNAGRIDEKLSFLDFCSDVMGYIPRAAWRSSSVIANRHPEYVGMFDKFVDPESKFRMNELDDYIMNNPEYVMMLQLMFLEDIKTNYPYQSDVSVQYHNEVHNMFINAMKSKGHDVSKLLLSDDDDEEATSSDDMNEDEVGEDE